METVSPNGPEREPSPAVHHDSGGSTTACGLNFATLGHLQFDHVAEAVTCPACLDVLDRANSPLAPLTDAQMDGALTALGRALDAELHEQRAVERLAELVDEEPAAATLTLDAVQLVERRDEFTGRRISITWPDGKTRAGALKHIFDRGWDTPQSQRLQIGMADGRTFLLGYRMQITIEPPPAEVEQREAWDPDGLIDSLAGVTFTAIAPADPITPEVYAEHFPERNDAGVPLTAEESAAHEPDVDCDCGLCVLRRQPAPAPAAPERRTVGLEVLTDELRDGENARRIADAREASKFRVDGEQEKPDLLPGGARVGIVLRLDGEPVSVPETDAMWLAGFREPPDVLEVLLRQARFYADDHEGAELLMPGPDVLAALAGQPVGNFTAPIQLSYGKVRPGWWVLVDGDDGAEPRYLPVVSTSDCQDPGCPLVADGGDQQDCRVIAVGGRLRHRLSWDAVYVRIPADTELSR